MTYDIYKLENILEEMRQYNPKADEYGGRYIIPGWAERIEEAIKDIKVESESRRQFILNGVEFGYIRLPDSNDPAFHVYQRCINAQAPLCERCNGTGMEDSGGFQPWGESILIECQCQLTPQHADGEE
ncbi:TPA: hypothetical protein ACNOH0_003774 [Enterobacter hormaechei]|uniref:hypothetical protein n=1 Tax=Enterobacter cloacae complex TaxID=354276 RepID=UPI002FCED812